MKKIIIIISVIISVLIIYLITVDRKIYYLALGDDITINKTEDDCGYSNYVRDYLEYYGKLEIYINEFSQKNYRITDLITDIDNNKKVKVGKTEKSIKNALIKADLLTLSIGMNDLTSIINMETLGYEQDYQYFYNRADEIIKDLEKLLIIIREYCKEDIFLIGIYYPYQLQNSELNNVFSYLNNRYKEICRIYNVNYIEIYDLFNANPAYLATDTNQPSKEGLEAIGNQIVVMLNNRLLKKSWFYKKILL